MIPRLALEAIRTAKSQPVSSVVTALIVSAVCSVILSTTGQTVQAERQVLSQIDAAGTRSVILADTDGRAGITSDAVGRIAAISGVEWVIGLGPATDVRTPANPGGQPAAIRNFFGDIPASLVVFGLPLSPGMALVGDEAQTTLGLDQPVGGVVGDEKEYAIVGSFHASEPLSFLNRTLISGPTPEETTVRAIHILTKRPQDVATVSEAALALLGAADKSSVGIQTSEELAEIRSAIENELGSFGRRLIAIVLGVGLILAALNVYGTVTTRRRDFGRRRALGAGRPLIVALVALQTVFTAVVGAIMGTVCATLAVSRINDHPPDWGFAVAVGVLAVMATALASIPPALVAAYRDPVRILRIP